MKCIFFALAFCSIQVAHGQNLQYSKYVVDTLCSSSLAGRGYVENGSGKAAEFISAHFDSLGISALNGNRFQEFKHAVNTFPETPGIYLNGDTLEAGVHFLVNAGSHEFEAALNVVHLDTSIIDHPEQIALRDHTAYLVHPVSPHNRDGASKRAGLVHDLAQHVPVINPVEKLTWSVGTSLHNFPVIEIDQQETNWQQSDSITIRIKNEWHEAYSSRNVLGKIEGTNGKEEAIVFTAHYDHLGKMGEVIFPGANDNASGTAMLLDLARHYAENPPEFDVLFIAFAGEEAGLVGSKHFVDHPLIPLDKIRFLINLDLMGNGEDGITVVNGKLFEEDFHLLAEINSENEFLPKIRARGSAANSDHYWFSKNGVPAFFIYTLGERKAYHDIYDVPETLEFAGYEGVFGLILEFALRL